MALGGPVHVANPANNPVNTRTLDSSGNPYTDSNALPIKIIGSSGNTADVNTEGQIHVVQRGKVDVNNSTAVTLSAGGVFTGSWVETLDYAVITVLVYSNVISKTDGLEVQFSSDGTNEDGCDLFTIAAETGKTFSFQPQGQYYRIKYTNGSTIQAEFRLQSIIKKSYVKPSSHRIQDEISSQDDAELVKSAITGEDPTGTWRNVNTTQDGDLSISDNSSGLSIAQGLVTDTTFIHKFGNAPNFDSADNEVTVWDGASDGASYEAMNYTWSTTADIDSLSSSSASDTLIDIEIQGLDSNYNEVIQTITLNGQSRVALTTNLIRVYRLTNIGMISLAGECFCYVDGTLSGGVPTDTSTIRAIISQGITASNNQTLMSIYTVPSGLQGFMRDWYATIAGANKTSNYMIRLYARPFNSVFQLKHISSIGDQGTSAFKHNYIEPEIYDEKTDLMMTVAATAAGVTGAAFSSGFDLVLKTPIAITGNILQESGFRILQENGDRLLR